MNQDKIKIAIWGAGIFPDAGGSKGIPAYVEILNGLSIEYDIKIYSHLHLRVEDVPTNIRFQKLPYWSTRRINYLFLIMFFIRDHLIKRYDLLQAHSSHPDPTLAIILGKVFRLPVLVGFNAGEFCELPEINFGAFLSRKQKAINKWVINNATFITAVSNFQAQTIKKHLKYLDKLQVIYRGVNQLKFIYEERKLSTPIQFINVGYHHPVKDQLTLLNTFAVLLNRIPCHLHLVGRDLWNNTVYERASELGLNDNITYHGTTPHNEIYTLYKKTDIMLHTARYESIGVSIAEAMASGVLVCGTRVGLMADLDEVCCLTVDPTDFQGLAAKVLDLVKSPNRQNKLKQNSLQWINKHNLEYAIKEYSSLYERIKNGH